jgi:hypothetical protein
MAQTRAARTFVLAIGVSFCLAKPVDSWYSVVLVAVAVGASAMALLLYTDPNLSAVRSQIRVWLGLKVCVE